MRVSAQSLLVFSALCAPSSAYLPPDNQQPLGHHASLEQSQQTHHGPHENAVPSYREPLLSLHRALVNVPSISGSEGDVAWLLEKLLIDRNYTVRRQPVPSENNVTQTRYNVVAWPGRDAHRTLDNRVLITSHIDVVPPYIPYRLDNVTVPPRQPVNFTTLPAETLISGRGSVDAKASVAAQITAVTSLVASGSTPPERVVLLYVVGEETSGQGMKHFSSTLSNTTVFPEGRPKFASAIFGEPTENKLACGHKGITTALLTATGRAGHSGYPWLGKSATALLVNALHALLTTDLGSSERYGNTTVNVGTIEGGVAANVIAKEAKAKVAVRIAVGDKGTGAEVVGERMRRVVEGVDKEDLRLEVVGGYGPVECECEVDGFETMIANYGTDVPNLDGEHVSYLYGPGSILVAHGDDEGLTVKDLEDSVEGYKRLIKHAVDAS